VTLIVTDASPLIVLARSGLVTALVEVAGQVIVPAAVMAECTDEPSRPGAQAILRARDEGLIEVRPDVASEWPGGPPSILGPGELAAIAFARHLGCAVLMDDRLGRQVARLHGIPVIGSAGVLLAAKARGSIPAVAPVLAEWKQWGYFLAPDLLLSVLARAGEEP
jgi:predicted nucleic acid-binding protein